MDADPDDFSRRLKISSYGSPRASHAGPAANGSPGKLYNPNTDPIRRTAITAEPEAIPLAACPMHIDNSSTPTSTTLSTSRLSTDSMAAPRP
ncbi:hypothetical protein OH77DRAFT_1525916 [Trametes cingulata]|nr:hypothetical protein OH77DRAFT_1525916 [Trametes cingulata]